MLGSKSLSFRLILVTTLCTTLIFASILAYSYYRSRTVLLQELQDDARNLSMSLVNRLETKLVSVTGVTEGMARALETGSYNEQQMLALIKETVRSNPQIHGSAIAFEPYARKRSERLYAPYFYRSKDSIKFTRLDKSYQHVPYLYWDWYQIPRELGKTEWSEPYFDEGAGGTAMSTCSVPFYGNQAGNRQLKGIATADISLSSLTELVSSVKVLKSGYAALLSRNGILISHPLQNAAMNESFFSIAEARNDQAMRELGRRMIRGESGFIHHTSLKGFSSWMYYAPIPSTGWTLAVVFPENELLESVNRLSMQMAAMGIAGIMLLTAAVILIARSITTPLKNLARATAAISDGNFDVELPDPRYRDEVGTLTRSFMFMKGSLKEYIARLTETTAAKERFESELNIAHSIQMDFLPKIFPPFPEREEFDLFAVMEPAKEVGGDFYDFFMLDEDRLCFVIADVSGKGVPASLFMAMSMTLIRATAREAASPEEILFRVNKELARDNSSCMFVTTFCAILDTRSGAVCYANGGHNPPLHIRNDVSILRLPNLGGLMVGALEGSTYKLEHLVLEPGERLFLYTDGVTEAMNDQEQFFTMERLEQELSTLHGRDTREMVEEIKSSILAFTGDAPQSDDITMLMLQYRGKHE